MVGWVVSCGGDRDTTAPTDTASPTTSISTCVDDPERLNLAWPLAGVDAQDWVTVQYVDLDETQGKLDYTGNTSTAAKTYDGHHGVDIGLSSFRRMDEGIEVLAAASGVVEYVVDGFEDRHTACVNYDANMVGVRHASGHLLHYVHLRTNSVVVEPGQAVVAGDVLGQVGSSGCSDGPHLHFEISDPSGAVIDPFLDGLWCDPPVYDTPMTFMEGWLLAGPAESYDNPLQDPPTEVSHMATGQTLLAYAIVGGGLPGESIGVQLVGPGGETLGPWPITFDQSWQLTGWTWAFTLQPPAGTWTVDYLVNDLPVAHKELEVE